MATVDRDILTIVEPTIVLDELFIEDDQSEDAQKESLVENQNMPTNQQGFEGGIYPMVQIGSNKIMMEDLVSMELTMRDFLPTAIFVIDDNLDRLSSIEYPLDGTVVSLYLKPKPMDVYRPIRIDFDILRISSTPRQPPTDSSDPEDKGSAPSYTFFCQMKVPLLFADVLQGFDPGNSFDHLLECAEGLGLGFASNEDSTDDPMPRICAQTSRLEFINDTTLTAYKDDESFFTSYVDLQYYLCLVNVNKQFSEDDETETVPIMGTAEMDVQSPPNEEAQTSVNGNLVLSNGQDYVGSDMQISSYNLVNNSGSIWMDNGYQRRIKYLNLNENINGGATGGLESFTLTPLNTPGAEENKIPLRGRPDEETWQDNTKIKYIGKQPSEDFENVHSNYMYAIANNFGNQEEMDKMYMEVELATVNWSLYKYQRVPVLIYTKGEIDNKTLEDRDAALGENVQPPNSEEAAANPEVDYSGPNTETKNEFLSGYYVISDVVYKYNKEATKITQSLKLLRREWPIPAKNSDN